MQTDPRNEPLSGNPELQVSKQAGVVRIVVSNANGGEAAVPSAPKSPAGAHAASRRPSEAASAAVAAACRPGCRDVRIACSVRKTGRP